MKTKQQILRKYRGVIGRIVMGGYSDSVHKLLVEKANTLKWVLEMSDHEEQKIINELKK